MLLFLVYFVFLTYMAVGRPVPVVEISFRDKYALANFDRNKIL